MPQDPGIDESPWTHAEKADLIHRAQALVGLDPDAELTQTPEGIQVRLNSHEEIVVLVTPEAFEIRLPTIKWTGGTHGPVATTRFWRRVRSASVDVARLQAVIKEASEVRRSEFCLCRFCGESFPIESRLDDVCHGCASQHLGVVF